MSRQLHSSVTSVHSGRVAGGYAEGPSDAENFLQGFARLLGSAVHGLAVGGPLGAIAGAVDAVIGGAGGGGVGFDGQLRDAQRQSEQLLQRQFAMNQLSEWVAATSNLMRAQHDAAMSVINNFKN